MIIFSHRGLGFGKEENSADSYKEVLRQGFSLETDVQKTKDDELIVSHDVNLMRQREIDKNLTDMNFEELIQLNIPSFEQVLDCFKQFKTDGELLAIHVKDEMQGEITDLVSKALKKYNLEKSCFLFDVTKNYANHIKQINSNVQIAYSVGEKRFSNTIYLWEDVKDDINFDAVWWDEWNSGLYNKENFDKIKKRGKRIYVISPELHKIPNHPKGKSIEKTKEVWKDLIELKVDGICTDYPLELREFIRSPKKQ